VKITLRAKGLPRTVMRETSSTVARTCRRPQSPTFRSTQLLVLQRFGFPRADRHECGDRSVLEAHDGRDRGRGSRAPRGRPAGACGAAPAAAVRDEAVASRLIEIPIPLNYPAVRPCSWWDRPRGRPRLRRNWAPLGQSLQDEPAPSSVSTLQEASTASKILGRVLMCASIVPFGLRQPRRLRQVRCLRRRHGSHGLGRSGARRSHNRSLAHRTRRVLAMSRVQGSDRRVPEYGPACRNDHNGVGAPACRRHSGANRRACAQR